MENFQKHPDSMADYTGEFSQFYNSDEDELGFEELNPNFAEVNGAAVRYGKFSEIGCGGMKRIGRVYDHASGRTVAMARLHDDAPKDLYESFLCEARLTAGLQHPNIIPVYDVGILDGAPYFTMELKTGQSLAEMIKGKCLSSEQGLEIFLKVCDAISYAHSRSVVHLDLKPENIQIGEFGGVMVCDWGLGKILGTPGEDPETQIFNSDMLNDVTLTGEIKGTPGFMAPEQIERDGIKNEQTDVFALGALLYTLLTLRNSADYPIETIFEKTCAGELFPFNAHTPAVPKSLRAVVAKATALKPQQRYLSVADLRTDVHHYLSGYPTAAEHAGFAKQLLLLLKRNQRISIILLLVACFTLGVTFYAFHEIRESAAAARKERDAARESLGKYMLEKRHSSELGKRYEDSVIELAEWFQAAGLYFDQTRRRDYYRVLQGLDQVLANNSNNVVAVTYKVRLLVIMQDFEKAAHCVRQVEPSVSPLFMDLVKEYALKYPGGKYKEPDVIAGFIRTQWEFFGQGKAPYAEMMMAYDALVRSDLAAHSLIVREVVQNYNPVWDHELFEYDAAKRSLLIGGHNLKSFISDRYNSSEANILRTLNLDALVIQSAEFDDLNAIAKLKLDTLDIRGTSVHCAPERNGLMKVSRLICRPNQFSAEEKAKFPSHVRVVEN